MQDDIQHLLLKMRPYGRPALFAYADGAWGCSISLEIRTQGFTAEVRSNFTCKSPLEAVSQCHERLLQSLSTFENISPKLLR
jgi:hypothetical protein